MNTYRSIKPQHLPEPFLIDSEHLLKELDRVRSLVFAIPHRNENVGPINSVIDCVWRLQEQIRYLLLLRSQGQAAFAAKASTWTDTKAKTAQTTLVAAVRAARTRSE
jgi:hypothetical protein